MAWLRAAVAVVLCCLTSAQLPPSESYPFSMVLDSDCTLYWKFDVTGVTLEIICWTRGWIGLGFSKTGTMAGSDVFTAGVRSNGEKYIHDRFAQWRAEPQIDEKQNVVLQQDQTTESGGYTRVTVKRVIWALDAMDSVIGTGLVHVIWAYGSNDADASGGISKHVRYGSKKIELLPLEDLKNSMTLDAKCILFWEHDDVTITFEIRCETKGYVGLGISPTGDMTDADMFIGWIVDDRPTFHDRYSQIYHTIPKIDKTNHWELLYSREDDTLTVFRMRRDLAAFDTDDRAISDGTVCIIWAYHSRDGGTNNFIHYHGNETQTGSRGSKCFQLITQAPTGGPGGTPANTDWVVPVGSYPCTRQMSPDFHVFWKTESSRITFEVIVRDAGWVSLGLSTDGLMANSDIVFGWIRNGLPTVQDAWATAQVHPDRDSSQDWTVAEASKSPDNGVEIVKMQFSRALATGDSKDLDITCPGELKYVLWAYGLDTPSGNLISYHGDSRRGALLLDLCGCGAGGPQNSGAVSLAINQINNNLGDVDDRLNCLEAGTASCPQPRN